MSRVRCDDCNLAGRPEPNAEQLAETHNTMQHSGARRARAVPAGKD